jgi:hypothetical protein
MTLLLIHSHYGPAPQGYAVDPRVLVVRERELTASHFAAAAGLLTTTHLDQVGLMQHRPALQALLDRGGRWFFNGHILREFVDGLARYVPLQQPRRADLAMMRLADHPIFSGIEQRSLEENKGVAGFYGRGHNPLPAGARAVNGIGPGLLPIDWDWPLPGGGRMFSHAGNDLGGMGAGSGTDAVLTRRIIAWCLGELT